MWRKEAGTVLEGSWGKNLFVGLKTLRAIKPREMGRGRQFFRLSEEVDKKS